MLLEVRDIKKRFRGVKAVDGVSFEVNNDEILAIVGPNGAGKTTIINIISGYMKPDSGKILFKGIDITKEPSYKRTRMGIVRSFQLPSLFENMSVFDNVRVAIFSRENLINRFLPADRYKRVNEETFKILEMFGLEKKREFLPRELSEGERKLLDVAIAFAMDPELLLMDEPTSGVSTRDKFNIMDTLVRNIKERKISAVIVEHDFDIVSSYADRVMVLNEGKVVAIGKPIDILEDSEVKKILWQGVKYER